MNTFLSILWGLINPDMFAAVADTLEDVMQARGSVHLNFETEN